MNTHIKITVATCVIAGLAWMNLWDYQVGDGGAVLFKTNRITHATYVSMGGDAWEKIENYDETPEPAEPAEPA